MRLRNSHGFSLVDLLVGATISLMVGAGVVAFTRSQTLGMRTQAGQIEVNDTARGVIDLFTREMRLAGYNPRCLNPSPVVAFVDAEAQQVRVQFDLDEGGDLDAAGDPPEDITYAYDNEKFWVQRIVGGPGGVATTIASGVPEGAFLLRYFDYNGDELLPGEDGALSPEERAAIERVSILFAPTQLADARVATQVDSPLWTNILIRNRDYRCQ